MRVSVWHRTEEQNPDKSGYYLSYRGFGMGGMSDYDHANGYMYYDKKSNSWYDYDDMRDTAIVYYWSDADPEQWCEEDPPSVLLRKKQRPTKHVALEDAWKDVEEAIKRYKTVEALCQS
jgi:hypothetical protein